MDKGKRGAPAPHGAKGARKSKIPIPAMYKTSIGNNSGSMPSSLRVAWGFLIWRIE